ncbi:MAG: DUF4906 domain-containing protein [Duncaniella sp.]|nr:DUF4906 domain-containing protein [Duncaniella sp.]
MTTAICSCNDDDIIKNIQQDETHGEEITLTFAAKLMSQSVPTETVSGSRYIDEGVATDYMPHDIWLLQFGPDNKRIGSPVYYDLSKEGSTTVKIMKSSEEYKVRYFVIANTFKPSFNDLKSVSDINQLKGLYKTISEEKDLLVSDGSDNYELMMNGEGEVTNSDGIDRFICTLYRNVAKVEITISNKVNSGMQILQAKLCNVAPRIAYADRLLAGDELTVNTDNQKMVEYEWDNLGGGVSEGGSSSLTYYLSRNKRGVFPQNVSAWQKNNYAPDDATYLDIAAKRISDNVMFVYRFYLGANLINDFNIEPNNLYKYNLTIEDCGVESLDSRVYDYSPVDFDTANSYIINSSFTSRRFSFPIQRINEFWNDSQYVEDEEERIGHALTDETEWVAEVIWQDINAPVIKFVSSPDGKCYASEDGKTFHGIGSSSRVYFVTDEANHSKKGNVLIGVRLKMAKAGEYLWSWHLWLTDYNPDDYQGTWEDGKYIYTASRMNGEVHRYAPVDGNISLWGGDNPTYKNKFVMDRPLGAEGTEYVQNRNGLIYHYGRKDPITFNQLYDIDGNPITHKFTDDGTTGAAASGGLGLFNFKKAQVKVYEGVLHPTTVYYGHDDYNSQFADRTDIIWSDPKCPKGSKDKSIFDPCPPGWRIPEPETFRSYVFLRYVNKYSICRIAGTDNSATTKCPIDRYLENAVSKNNWSAYWYNTPANEKNGTLFWVSGSSFSYVTYTKSSGVFVRPVRQ